MHLNATESLVIAQQPVPVRTVLAGTASVRPRLLPCSAHRAAAVGILVCGPWKLCSIHTAKVHGSHILSTSRYAVVHIGIEVVALRKANLTDVNGQAQGHQRVSLVTPRLLHLTEPSERPATVGMEHRHKVAYELIAAIIINHALAGAVLECAHMVILVERHSLIVHMDIIAQYADAHDAK